MKTYIFKIKTSYSANTRPINEFILGCCANNRKEAFDNIASYLPDVVVYSKLMAICENYTVFFDDDSHLIEEGDVVIFK